MIKLIMFDWDDVIILGSKKGYYNCYRETLSELGVTLDEKEMDIRIKRKWGQPFREELRSLLQENTSLLDEACDIFYNKKFHGEAFVKELEEVRGVNDLLVRLSKKYKLAVATGNQREMIVEKMIPRFRIPEVFCQIVTSHDTNIPKEKTKPDPYMLNIILQEQGIKNSEALYVGDAENDMQMALNAGVEPVAVLTGHLSQKEAESLHIKHILSDVTKIEGIL
ncbi:MAG: HAD family hydrolase [Microgenomates group bacterium]